MSRRRLSILSASREDKVPSTADPVKKKQTSGCFFRVRRELFSQKTGLGMTNGRFVYLPESQLVAPDPNYDPPELYAIMTSQQS